MEEARLRPPQNDGMSLLERSCCACSLKIGTRYIGILFIATRGFMLLVYITSLRDPKRLSKTFDDHFQVFYNTLILLSCECVVNIIVSVLLFASTVKLNRYLMLPWLMWNTVGVLFVQIVCLGIVSQHRQLDKSEALTFGTLFILAVLSQIYFVCIVASFYQQLECPHNPSLYDDIEYQSDIDNASLFSLRTN